MGNPPKEPTLHSQTFTTEHSGFPPILWDMLTRVLGYSAHLKYLDFKTMTIPNICRYHAEVYTHSGTMENRKPLVFQGIYMPIPKLAIQTAGVEAIAHLRSLFSQVAEMREFCYFPFVADLGREVTYPNANKDANPVVAHLL